MSHSRRSTNLLGSHQLRPAQKAHATSRRAHSFCTSASAARSRLPVRSSSWRTRGRSGDDAGSIATIVAGTAGAAPPGPAHSTASPTYSSDASYPHPAPVPAHGMLRSCFPFGGSAQRSSWSILPARHRTFWPVHTCSAFASAFSPFHSHASYSFRSAGCSRASGRRQPRSPDISSVILDWNKETLFKASGGAAGSSSVMAPASGLSSKVSGPQWTPGGRGCSASYQHRQRYRSSPPCVSVMCSARSSGVA